MSCYMSKGKRTRAGPCNGERCRQREGRVSEKVLCVLVMLPFCYHYIS